MQQAQMIKGILEGCVLRVVDGRFCYSQEIVDYLRKNGFPDMSSGTLFPLLLRLEKAGCFESRLVPSGAGPSRKYYRLNAYGQQQLADFIIQWERLKRIVDGIVEGGGTIESEQVEQDV